MKILYHHRVASRDGQFVHIESIIGALRKRHHQVVLVGPAAAVDAGSGQTSSLVSLLKRLLPKPAYEFLELAYGLLDYIRVAREFMRIVPDVLYERYNLHTLACTLLRRRHAIPFLLEVNAPLVAERCKYGGLGWPSLAAWSEGLIWRSADAILTVTRVLADEIEAKGVAANRIWVVPNAIDLDAYQNLPDIEVAKERIGLAGRRVLGFVGFVRDWHGLDRVIAWLGQRTAPEVVLLIVGDGPAVTQLTCEAVRRGVDNQLFVTGALPHDEIPAYIASFDLALQPAVVPYASPLKMFEYMAMGRPIIAPDTPNIREILTHGHDAWLAKSEEVPDAIDCLLSDEPLRLRLGREARRTIERHGLTWDRNAMRIEEIVGKIMEGRQTDL